MRIWRRTSFRNYVLRAPPADNHWSNFRDRTNELFHPAYLHLVHEGGNPADYGLETLISNAEYESIVWNTVTASPWNNYTPCLDKQYIWPYMDGAHIGFT